jgi:hypothetical protein
MNYRLNRKVGIPSLAGIELGDALGKEFANLVPPPVRTVDISEGIFCKAIGHVVPLPVVEKEDVLTVETLDSLYIFEISEPLLQFC